MRRRSLLAATAALPVAAPGLARGQVAARTRTLRFMPQAALASLDPVFSPSTIITTHAYCIFDTLYGADRGLRPRPQMAAGQVVEDDGRTVLIRLRDGLRWHDGAPVRAADCVASIRRWGARDSFGQIMMRATAELSA
ncbi:MAG: ABC transporter substrate-binding protein, partial [Acetobacteraceae bacterium]|nr:ABC transporter substrate-binding protein [Acetobacteraceae bacterium]